MKKLFYNIKSIYNHFDRLEEITKTGSFSWDLENNFLSCSNNFFRITYLPNKKDQSLDMHDFFSLIDFRVKSHVIDILQESTVLNQEFETTFSLEREKEKKIRLFGQVTGDLNKKTLIGLIQDISDLESSRRSIILGQDSERKRISLELHDGVGQKLIAIKYQLALIKMTKDMSNISLLDDSLNDVINEIRSITHNLSSQLVSEVGLKNSVNQVLTNACNQLNASKSYTYDLFDKNMQELNLGEDYGKMIYRIVQEAMANAIKYSKATNLHVSLRYVNNQVLLKIVDNGVGMNVLKENMNGIGLHNIKERVSYLNGSLRIFTKKDKGFTISIKIPYTNE